jgi:GntR family transcriptional regulator/MocR family aminotransferase
MIRSHKPSGCRRNTCTRSPVLSADPVGQVEGISAGLHALVRLPAGVTERGVVAAAAARGLALEGLDAYRVGPSTRHRALIVGCTTPPEHGYRSALEVLVQVLATSPAVPAVQQRQKSAG